MWTSFDFTVSRFSLLNVTQCKIVVAIYIYKDYIETKIGSNGIVHEIECIIISDT